MIHAMPPHSMNCCSASMSAVTRATNTPRFSSDWSAIDSEWMCENVVTRSCIIAFSAATTSRRPAIRAATNATITSANPIAQIEYVYFALNGLSPWSNTFCSRIGVTSDTTVTPSETTTVMPRPRRSSVLSPTPRFRTAQAPWSSSGTGSASSSVLNEASSALIEHLLHVPALVRADDRRVAALCRQELVVCPGAGDPSALQVDHPVGQLDRRQAVGHHDQGGVELAAKRLQDVGLDRRVDRRCRVVEDQDARLTRERSRQRDPLALTARDGVAALADDGVVGIWQLTDEPVGRGDHRRAHDLVGVDGVVERDVLAHARREQEALLEHDRGRRAQLERIGLAHVDPTDGHDALVRIREADKELHERRLPDAGRPHDRDRLAGLDVEAHAVQHGEPVVDQLDVFHRQAERSLR